MDTINQRAERQLLSLGKVELFNTSLNGTPLPPLFQAALRKDVPKAGKAAAGKAAAASTGSKAVQGSRGVCS